MKRTASRRETEEERLRNVDYYTLGPTIQRIKAIYADKTRTDHERLEAIMVELFGDKP